MKQEKQFSSKAHDEASQDLKKALSDEIRGEGEKIDKKVQNVKDDKTVENVQVIESDKNVQSVENDESDNYKVISHQDPSGKKKKNLKEDKIFSGKDKDIKRDEIVEPVEEERIIAGANIDKEIKSKKSKKKFYKRKVFIISLIVFLFLLIIVGVVLWKTGSIFKKISPNSGVFSNLMNSIPGSEKDLKGKSEGRINILLLGMRGEKMDGGGLLADTIMVMNIKITETEKRMALVSIPRDMQVTVPATGYKEKINSVYHHGEEKQKGQGLTDMKQIVSEISGQPIHYALAINFKGFEELVDSLGGVEVNLEEAFVEPVQFKEERVCDENVFTVPSGNYEVKYYVRQNGTKYEATRYPLCYNTDLECGGVFEVPAGESTLTGEETLCYVRSRSTSSDFDRARRQQEVVEQIKKKALNLGNLASFEKASGMLNALGDNVTTDMEIWEMKKFYELQNEFGDDLQITQKVLENSEEGLLYVPADSPPEVGYILLPRGDNYDRIHQLFRDV